MTGKPPESGRSPVVHLALAEKFIAPFIAFTREHFPADRHRFVVRGENRNYPVVEGPGVRVIRSGTWHPRTLWAIYSECRDAERIILHGLYCRVILAILLLFRRFRRKAFWFSWGSDINDPAHRHRVSLSRRLRYLMRRRVAPDLAALVCYVPGTPKPPSSSIACAVPSSAVTNTRATSCSLKSVHRATRLRR